MALDTPTGMQPADDGLALAFNYGSWRPWEQNGLTTTAGKPAFYSNDPLGHYTWRKARSDDNKTKPGPFAEPDNVITQQE